MCIRSYVDAYNMAEKVNTAFMTCVKLEWTVKIVTGPAKINHVSAKNHRFFLSLLKHNLRTVCTNTINSVTTAEFNELSSKIDENGIPCSELKILPKI